VTRILPLLAAMVVLPCFAEEKLQSYAPGIELPEGEGKLLLLAACVRCHDLKGLPAYRDYWDNTRWLSMIDNMMKNGAALNPQQATALAEYLAQHFGKPSQTENP
jgi:mono/diheme cytochrome c family protein